MLERVVTVKENRQEIKKRLNLLIMLLLIIGILKLTLKQILR